MQLCNINCVLSPISTFLLAKLHGKFIYLNVTMIYSCNYVYPFSVIVCCNLKKLLVLNDNKVCNV